MSNLIILIPLEHLNCYGIREIKDIFSLKGVVVSYGLISAYIRTFKGLILGIGLGNLLIQKSKQYPFIYYLAFFIIIISVLIVGFIKVYRKWSG